MSLELDAKVVCKPLNNCLISLPVSFIYPIINSTNLLVQQLVLHLADSKTDQLIASVGWNGLTTKDSSSIEIDTQYAKILQINEGTTIHVKLDPDMLKSQGPGSFATSVEIEPITTADWELTEIYAQAIELNFLSQVRCVRKNQELLIRANPTPSGFSNSGSIRFKVIKIKSLNDEVDFSPVGNNTELFIIPKPHRDMSQSSKVQDSASSAYRKKHGASSKRSSLCSETVIRRSAIDSNGSQITVYNKGKKIPAFRHVDFVQISVLEGPGTPPRARKTTSKELEIGLAQNTFGKPIVARYIECENSENNRDNHDDGDLYNEEILDDVNCQSFYLSPLLSISLGLEYTCGDMVLLEPCSKKSIKMDLGACKFVIHKLITDSSDDDISLNSENKLSLMQGRHAATKEKELKNNKLNEENLKQNLLQLFGLGSPLSNGMKLPIIESILPNGALLEIVNTTRGFSEGKNQTFMHWTMFSAQEVVEEVENEQILKSFSLEIGKNQLVPTSRIQTTSSQSGVYEIFGQEKILAEVTECLQDFIPTFLYGKAGSGKSLFCNVIKQHFNSIGFYTTVIDFNQAESNDITDNSDDTDTSTDTNARNNDENNASGGTEKESNKNKYLSQLFDTLLSTCTWRSPSLVILENLDKILLKETENLDSGSSTQLCQILINKFEKSIRDKKISLLITSKSKESINQMIFQRHFVDEEFGLIAPNKHQLSSILKNMMARKFPDFTNEIESSKFLSDVILELEGYLPLDLENLLDRAFHNMVTQDRSSFEKTDFLQAIEGYIPTSLRGVKLQKSVTNWSDIGGLIDVKRILLETLEWPTKYAPIFEKCTLRLRSGILLYGYPGCGKTMLASAIASKCGLNFISVKGPEILNKYIGASEQSIRELFERAQSAKPCILFFDEFDSIAPKRGHDSTGVTDRIVNQLLTQMDGAEGLEGVYVLAATSRPDLIDSALLRPGRLDKSVICDLPDFENRLDILKTIVKGNGFTLAGNGDELDVIARNTSGYTGADLQAVVYNAYLKSVNENLASKNEENDVQEIDKENLTELTYRTIVPNDLDYRKKKTVYESRKRVETLVTNYKKSFSLSNELVNGDENNQREKDRILIHLRHLEESLEETKKSISVKELEKLENIYSKFESSKRPSEMRDGEGSKDVGVRATLM